MRIEAITKHEESSIANKKTPDCKVTDINGKEYSLSSLKGKTIIMNFWFVECKPYVQEIPELNELVHKYQDDEVVFLGFSTNKKDKINSFIKEKEFHYN